MIKFGVLKKSKKSWARVGFLQTPHGEVETPSLVPVATQAAIKTLPTKLVEQTGTQIIISNTFHLHLKPGENIVKKAGGIHKFMNWPHPVMTDYGGFQVFSLGFGHDLQLGKIKKFFPGKVLNKEVIDKGAQPKKIKITEVGVYYNPLATVVDIRFLKSLSRDQLIDGLGEIIKAGLIKDASILSLLKKDGVNALKRSSTLTSLIKKSMAVKQFYIQKDPREIYWRQILNAGYTVGHAVELKHKLSHGKAVLFGLLKELSIGEFLGYTSPSVRKNLNDLLNKLDIKTNKNYSIDWESLQHDKKVRKNMIMLPITIKCALLSLIEEMLSIPTILILQALRHFHRPCRFKSRLLFLLTRLLLVDQQHGELQPLAELALIHISGMGRMV